VLFQSHFECLACLLSLCCPTAPTRLGVRLRTKAYFNLEAAIARFLFQGETEWPKALRPAVSFIISTHEAFSSCVTGQVYDQFYFGQHHHSMFPLDLMTHVMNVVV